MRRLQVVEVLLVDLDGLLELLDVLGTPLPESSLRLAVPLLPFLRCGVDLDFIVSNKLARH